MKDQRLKKIHMLSTSESPDLRKVGGKAFSLIKMKKLDMPIPSGFVLTVDFFEPWIEILQTKPEWNQLQKVDSGKISEVAEKLYEFCKDLKLTKQQNDELSEALKLIQVSDKDLFAIRSSSPEEDLEGASFAGAYETVLGVTPENIESAIKRSFASLFDKRLLLYKTQLGFSIDEPRIAIVIQRQIDSDCAGVAFSINLINNCYDEAVINANYGLGESVVSGKVTPDTFIVDKINNKIIKTDIGAKQLTIRLLPNGGTINLSNTSDQNNTCITQEQVLNLTALIKKIETHYQTPVDIEWAISNETIYVLQARPVTTFLPLPQEMQTAPGEPKILYADATLIEQGVEEPLSMLGADFVNYILKEMTAPFGSNVVGKDGLTFTAGGRYYLHLSNSFKMLGFNTPLAPGSYNDPGVKEILENINLKEYTQKKLPSKLKFAKYKMLPAIAPSIFAALRAYRNPESFLKKYNEQRLKQVNKLKTSEHKGSLKDYSANLSSNLNFFMMKYGLPFFVAPQISKRFIKNMFKKAVKNIDQEIASLMMSLPGNKTAEMGAMMYKLASFSETRKFSENEFIEQLEKKNVSQEFQLAWSSFIEEYGFRCFREIDAATPRANENPLLLFKQLKVLSLAVEDRKGSLSLFEEAKLKREKAYQRLSEVALNKGKRKLRSFENRYKAMLAFGGYRETPKHYTIMAVDLFRKKALQIAKHLVDAKRLDNVNQIFDLTIDDIDRASLDTNLDLRKIAEQNALFIKKIKDCHITARVIDSRGKIFNPPPKKITNNDIAGQSISPGVARGRVRVLHCADEKILQPGEILVARSTDPGWTPLFINAGGIVLEIGGALQHGAVVAREYGIPCVSGIDGATKMLKDGQLIEVDGSNGIIHIIEE